jgi:hypothetical protein
MNDTAPGIDLAEERRGETVAVPLPAQLSASLIQIALRTEVGAALWRGYALALLPRAPWLAGPLQFRPDDGDVVPRVAQAAVNGGPSRGGR